MESLVPINAFAPSGLTYVYCFDIGRCPYAIAVSLSGFFTHRSCPERAKAIAQGNALGKLKISQSPEGA